MSVAPSNCAIGTELSAVPYVNQLPGTHEMEPGHMDPNNVSSCLVRVLGTETHIHQRHPLPRFGNNKINYTCARCQPGTFKFLDTPTACTRCEAGRFSDQDGREGGVGVGRGERGKKVQKGAKGSQHPTSPKLTEVGQSTCGLCDVGYEAVNGTSCRACEPGRPGLKGLAEFSTSPVLANKPSPKNHKRRFSQVLQERGGCGHLLSLHRRQV